MRFVLAFKIICIAQLYFSNLLRMESYFTVIVNSPMQNKRQYALCHDNGHLLRERKILLGYLSEYFILHKRMLILLKIVRLYSQCKNVTSVCSFNTLRKWSPTEIANYIGNS